jgi:hypothetical protein
LYGGGLGNPISEQDRKEALKENKCPSCGGPTTIIKVAV